MIKREALRNQLYLRDGNKCHYCGIEEQDFSLIWGEFYSSNRRGSRLEIDRRDNNQGYDIDNCVLACAICNNSKSDKFAYVEFCKVGTVIGQIWQKRKARNH